MTLTKEWLQHTIAELEEERDAVPGVVNEDAARALAAMKLALASLEAEPVAVVAISNGGYDKGEKVINYFQDEIQHLPEGSVLYTATPSPVSVPECFKSLLHHAYGMTMGHDWNKGTMAGHHRAKLCQAVDECRASMFQGAEPVTTAYKLPFEQWLSQQTGTIDVECGCVMTEVFFHWLRVAYEAGNSPVIQDGWDMATTIDV
ncbi:TPA: hypothetical protein OMT60_004478 [Enterobacter hormaechei]|uniref:hypothetical protein n=1 Tax=Enterobacter hormaechei TaxID=158836 RepID=UPI003F440F63|nr:hypothetical protein [Enterobacter hormaechei]